MIKEADKDLHDRPVVVVTKKSRFSYVMEHEHQGPIDENGPHLKALKEAHEQNLSCIEIVDATLRKRGIKHRLICRSDLKDQDLRGTLVISVGGDGTLLETSHHCLDAPILGLNSDPKSSIGALCTANAANFHEVLSEIYDQGLKPIPLSRLSIRKDQQILAPLALNDVLLCHKNPASMSRFVVTYRGAKEAHSSSGIWISTPAGSTSGIFSAGAEALALDENTAIFRIREPYWTDAKNPQTLHGRIGKTDQLLLTCTMTDAELYIDGPHKSVALDFGETIEIGLAPHPLWLFDGARLQKNRNKIIEQRRYLRGLF